MLVHLLFPLVFGEMAVMLGLLCPSPISRIIVKCLNCVKLGTGRVVVQTLAATLLIVLVSTVYSMRGAIFNRVIDGAVGAMNPTEQVLIAYHILEASLLGTALFLGVMIHRLHDYLREINVLKMKVNEYEYFGSNLTSGEED